MEFIKFTADIDLKGFTLLIPSVSVGNIPQLTTDLLITTFRFEKIGTIWHPAIVPSVGGDPYEENGSEICLACELYANKTMKLALVQLRSTIEFKLVTKFFEDLKLNILNHQFKNVIILSSSFDYELHSIDKGKFFYITNEDVHDTMKMLHMKPLEIDFGGKYCIHGGGFSVKLFEVLSNNIQCTVVIKYVSEGDNRPDALTMMQVLAKILEPLKGYKPTDVKFPTSWNHMFGGPPPMEIY